VSSVYNRYNRFDRQKGKGRKEERRIVKGDIILIE
jgi:translation initiation factor IF-1